MPPYDPTLVALVDTLVTTCVPASPAAPYVEDLRVMQQWLAEQLRTGQTAPSPEAEQALRAAMSRLDAKPHDERVGYGEVLRRVLSAVDQELFRWTSAAVQPRGPSGDTAVAPAPAPVP